MQRKNSFIVHTVCCGVLTCICAHYICAHYKGPLYYFTSLYISAVSLFKALNNQNCYKQI